MKKYISPQFTCYNIEAKCPITVSVKVGLIDDYEIIDSDDILTKEIIWNSNDNDIWDDF